MTAGLSARPMKPDLTDEEWEALQRIHRGAPESLMVPSTIVLRLAQLGLAAERGGQRRVSERGRHLILRFRDTKRRS